MCVCCGDYRAKNSTDLQHHHCTLGGGCQLIILEFSQPLIKWASSPHLRNKEPGAGVRSRAQGLRACRWQSWGGNWEFFVEGRGVCIVEPLTSHFTLCARVPGAAPSDGVRCGGLAKGWAHVSGPTVLGSCPQPPEHTGSSKRAASSWHGLSVPDAIIFLEVQIYM